MKFEKHSVAGNEQVMVESKTYRDQYIENFDVLDKIKVIPYLTDDMVVTVQQVAEYYEVSSKAINTVIERNRIELEEDGVVVLRGQNLSDFKSKISYLQTEETKLNKTTVLTILTKRAMLRIGMLLTTSDIAKKVRSYLLNLEELSTKDQKEWAIQREVSKVDRKRMCTAISKYVTDYNNKRFAYPSYTNMIYTILFGKTAKELREEKNVKTNDLLRDSFTKNELEIVDEYETIVTGLLSLGFSELSIKEHLQGKFNKEQNIVKGV